MVEGNHWDQWFSDGFQVRQPLVMMVFDGCAPSVRRWNGYVPSLKSSLVCSCGKTKNTKRLRMTKHCDPMYPKSHNFSSLHIWLDLDFVAYKQLAIDRYLEKTTIIPRPLRSTAFLYWYVVTFGYEWSLFCVLSGWFKHPVNSGTGGDRPSHNVTSFCPFIHGRPPLNLSGNIYDKDIGISSQKKVRSL